MKTKLLLIAALSLLILPAHAQEDKKAEEAPAPAAKEKTTLKQLVLEFPIAFRYQPEYCDFTAAFPEEPIVSQQCEKEGDESTCYELVSYTKVFEMSSTVSVNIVCNPVTPEMYEYFSTEVMENTVREMTKESVVETFNVSSSEKENYRLTGLVGQGKKGLHDTLFIAQLWLSENSIMSVEAEISGQKHSAADELFAGILNHVGYAKEVIKE